MSTLLNSNEVPQSLNHLVELIYNELGSDKGLTSKDVNVDKIIRLIQEYKSEESEWASYALFDKSRSYTRNLLDDGNGQHYNLMILCWNEQKAR